MRVAQLEACVGDQPARFEHARKAFDLTPHELPTLDLIRLLRPLQDRTDRGYLGVSIGTERPGVPTYVEGLGAAGFIFTSEPQRPPDPCLAPMLSPDDGALDQALAAAVASKDAANVEAAVDAYVNVVGEEPRGGLVSAARMAVGIEVAPDAGPGNAVLDLVPDLSPADAAALCRRVRTSDPLADDEALIACEARGTSRAAIAAGDLTAAQRALEDGYEAQEAASVQPDPVLLLEAAQQAEARNNPTGAKALYLRASSFEATSAAAFSRLAQLAFRQDDLAGTLTLLDLAVASADRADPKGLDPDVVRTRGYLLSNRGVTRLGLTRTETGGAPDCTRFGDACALAAKDLEEALASDPASWVYTLNTAWVLRLTGRTAEAKERLAATIALAPETLPALNDLGVLEARDGEVEAARGRFNHALDVDPTYELARWNLGVLESAEGLTGWFAGQRDLGVAAAAAPQLRPAPVAYRTDENVYAVDLSAGTTLQLGRRGSAPGALVAAAAASVALLGGFITLGGGVRDAFADLVKVGSERFEAWFTDPKSTVRKRLRTRFKARTLRKFGWLAYLAVLAVTTGLSAWAAWPDAWASGIVLAAVATFVAVTCHALAHIGAAAAHDVEFRPATWRGGALVGLAGIALQLPTGPYPGEKLTTRRSPDGVDPAPADASTDASDATRTPSSHVLWRISVAGPIVNIAGAAIALGAYLIVPIPFLRLLIVTHLTVAAFSLITAQPLDGSRLGHRRPWVGAVLALVIALLAASISAGAV